MTRELPRRRFLTGSLAAAAVGAAPARSEAYMGCYVGVAAPLSGPLGIFGEQLRRGADLAIKDLKEKGMRVDLFVADDGCQPDRALQAANKFQADKVVCVFGHYCYAASLAASGFYERAKIVQIIPAPAGFASDGAGQKFVFRMLPRAEVEADLTGRALASRYKGKKVALAHSDASGARRQADAIKQSMSKQGLNAALDETYSVGATDFAPLADKLRANGIDAFYVAGPSLEAARIIRQVRQVGMSTQMVSGSILGAGEFGRVSAGAGEGTLMISSIDARDLPEAKAVVDAGDH
jgi:branched-chain amino acid transport system substrate-binding protein